MYIYTYPANNTQPRTKRKAVCRERKKRFFLYMSSHLCICVLRPELLVSHGDALQITQTAFADMH